eukprot:scpid60225/ scgid2686/ MIT domain-containing protein 1
MERAASILTRAADLDKAHRYSESLICYQEGIQLLLDALKDVKDGAEKTKLRARAGQYVERAEAVKSLARQEKEATAQHHQVVIEEGSVGHDYPNVFSRVFQGKKPLSVEVDDAYVRSNHQITNFLRFCELLVRFGTVTTIRLQTGVDDRGDGQQQQHLQALVKDLATHHITLHITYSDTLHDREIRYICVCLRVCYHCHRQWSHSRYVCV